MRAPGLDPCSVRSPGVAQTCAPDCLSSALSGIVSKVPTEPNALRPTAHERQLVLRLALALVVVVGLAGLVVLIIESTPIRALVIGLAAGGVSLFAAREVVDGFRHAVRPEERAEVLSRVRGKDMPSENIEVGRRGSGLQLAGVDLRGARLAGTELEYADLASARLERADLSRVHLNGAVLTGAHLDEALLQEAKLPFADLASARLERADLSRADVKEANLADARLGGAILRDAQLTRAQLAGADLRRVDFRGADLSGAALSRADLRDAYLHGAQLTRANFSGADLRGAYFEPGLFRSAQLDDSTAFDLDTDPLGLYRTG
jgi:uncharacterized protein YjbI with pentapeptide repeats